MAKFDWIKDKKRQAQQERLQRESRLDYSVQPVSTRFGWQNTGYGPDGVNQAHMPAMQVQSRNGPVNLHEGEPYRQLPDGSIQVVSQRDLLRDETTGMAGGMQQGGIIPPKRMPAARQNFPVPNVKPDKLPGGNVEAPTPLSMKPPSVKVDEVTPVNIKPQMAAQEITPAPVNIQPQNITQDVISAPDISMEGLTPTPISIPKQTPAPTPEPAPTPKEIPQEQKDFYEQMYKKGMGWVEQMMEGGSPAQKALYQKWIDDTAARQATERAVGAQQAAQGRVGETAAAARNLMLQRQHGIELGELAAAGGIEQMQASERAAEKLASLGLSGMQYGLAKEQLGLSKEELALKEKQHLFAQEQFEHAKDQYEYGKQLDTINALLAEGGEDNFKQASMMFQDMYGKDIDFSNSLTQENIGKFNQGWNNLGGLIASGMDWESAVKVMQQDGSLDMLGLTETDVKKIYEQQQLMNDPLYAQMQMVDTWVEQGFIDEEDKDVWLAIMGDMMSNPEGWSVQNGWTVKNKAGNEVGFFTDENEANEFIRDNPDYSSEYIENHISKTGVGPGAPTGGGEEITPKETFEDFQTSHVPQEEMEWFNQQVWEDLGKPKTWEDAQNKLKEKYGEVYEIYNKHDRETDLLKSDNTFSYSTEEMKEIWDALEEDNPFVIEKYGVPKDHVIYEFMDNIRKTPVTGKGITKDLTMSGSQDELMPITSEEMNELRGKMITYTDLKGNERKVIIDSYEEVAGEGMAANQIMQRIWVIDAETGKKDMIQLRTSA